jgi:orotate phosphoribosyltransferase
MSVEKVDPEELVVGLFDTGEIGYHRPPGQDVNVADPDYPEEIFTKLRSLRMSPHYVDVRNVTGFSSSLPAPIEQQRRTRNLVVAAFGEMLDEQTYDHHLGIPSAVTCVSGMIAQVRGDSVLWLRPAPKQGYGVHATVQGHHAPGERVVLNDNVITDAGTKLGMVQPVSTETGLEIVSFNVLVDREEGGAETIKNAGYEFASFIGMGAVCEILLDTGRISQTQFDGNTEYVRRMTSTDQPL